MRLPMKKANTTMTVTLACNLFYLGENIVPGFYKNAFLVMDYMSVPAISFQ